MLNHCYVMLNWTPPFDTDVLTFLQATDLKSKRTSFRSPWQNEVAERWIGSRWRELSDHIIPLNERNLRRLASNYIANYQDGISSMTS